MTQIIMFFVAFIVGMYLKFVHDYDTGFVKGSMKEGVKETNSQSKISRMRRFGSARGKSYNEGSDSDGDDSKLDDDDDEGVRSQIGEDHLSIRCLSFSINNKETTRMY